MNPDKKKLLLNSAAVALVIISFQVIKAAIANTVKSLRTEQFNCNLRIQNH